MERIHKSTKLAKGDIIKILGGYSGEVLHGRYHIAKIRYINRQKVRMLVNADILASTVPEGGMSEQEVNFFRYKKISRNMAIKELVLLEL